MHNGSIEAARRGKKIHQIMATEINRRSDGFLLEGQVRRMGKAEVRGNMIITDSNGRSCFLSVIGDGLVEGTLMERKTGQEYRGDRLQVVLTRFVLEQRHQIDRAVIIYNNEQKEVFYGGKRQDLIDLVVSAAIIKQANKERTSTRNAEKENYHQKSFWADTKQKRRDHKNKQAILMVEERNRLDELTGLVLPEIEVRIVK